MNSQWWYNTDKLIENFKDDKQKTNKIPSDASQNKCLVSHKKTNQKEGEGFCGFFFKTEKMTPDHAWTETV